MNCCFLQQYCELLSRVLCCCNNRNEQPPTAEVNSESAPLVPDGHVDKPVYDVRRSKGVAGEANGKGKPPVSDSESSARAVWMYEDMDEQWKEFAASLQATLELDYSRGCLSSVWQLHRQEHTVSFKTQPMTYMVKCGDTIELSTGVERRVMNANSRPAVTWADTPEVNSHTTPTQRSTTERPSANRKNNTGHQDDDTAIHQSLNEHQSSTQDPRTMNNEPTHVNTVPQRTKPSANRDTPSNPPNQSGDSMKSTPPSLSRESSENSLINVYSTHDRQTLDDSPKVKANDNVAMPTKYAWDAQDLPSHWAPMDGSSVKTVVLHPTDSEYQLVADTFLTSLGNTLATVVQIERIQSPVLLSQYMKNKEIMDETNPPATKNERHLWHGITVTMTQNGPMPVTAINARGFNRSYTGSASGEAVYGNGTYFAVAARSASRYSNPDMNGHRHMYWCRVLTGEYTRGRSDIVAPPVKTKGSYDLYDSVVDIVESPTMFVIFEDAKAYPEYLITFE